MGSAGKITLDQNATTHLVDGDDDASGDVKYTNTFGGATFTAVLDLDKDDSDVSRLTQLVHGYMQHCSSRYSYNSSMLVASATGTWRSSSCS